MKMKTKTKRLTRSLSAALVTLFISGLAVQAQSVARVRAEENFRKDPNGTPLAILLEGAELTIAGGTGSWAEVVLEGWIWSPSVTATHREGFDLRVSADGGENLRATPQGAIVARLLEGCLLIRVASQGNWARVRRQGWVWKPSLEMGGAPAAQSSEDANQRRSSTTVGDEQEGSSVLTAPVPLIIYATPDGDTVAHFRPGARAQILGRTGDWIRVRVDGWVYGPAAFDSAVDLTDTGNITPAQLRADPARYRGALVRWRVQFISLRRAERTRSDFKEGEPFIQARVPGDAGFVYLAVPEALIAVAEELDGLEYVTVVGRVRTGRSSLLGSPVVDLADIETER
jgi:hypothetical protein